METFFYTGNTCSHNKEYVCFACVTNSKVQSDSKQICCCTGRAVRKHHFVVLKKLKMNKEFQVTPAEVRKSCDVWTRASKVKTDR